MLGLMYRLICSYSVLCNDAEQNLLSKSEFCGRYVTAYNDPLIVSFSTAEKAMSQLQCPKAAGGFTAS